MKTLTQPVRLIGWAITILRISIVSTKAYSVSHPSAMCSCCGKRFCSTQKDEPAITVFVDPPIDLQRSVYHNPLRPHDFPIIQ
jgi:hypothetical protein